MKNMPLRGAAALLPLFFALGADAQDPGALYDRKCGRCHRVYAADEYSADQWPGLVRGMSEKAGLSPIESETISRYLVQAAGEGSGEAASGAPLISGYLYTEYFQSPEKTSNYDLHYLAIQVSGWASEQVAYLGEFELEHGGRGDDTFVEQAYLDYWFMPNLGLKIGAMLTPFNRFDEMHEPLANPLVTRPQISREIGVSAWKEVGADLHGYVNPSPGISIGFDLYTVNGLGDGENLRASRQYRDNNEDKAFGGRMSALIGDRLELGGSAYQGAWDDGGDYDLILLGAHARWTSPWIELYGEYARAESENPDSLDNGEMEGYFVQASRLVGGQWRPAIRLGALDYLDPGNALGRDPAAGDKEVMELALGLTWYPGASVAFKLEYTIFTEGSRMKDLDNDQLGLQAAVGF